MSTITPTPETPFDFSAFEGLVDQSAFDLETVEEERLPRILLVQGNKTFGDIPELAGTVKHTGGVGFFFDESLPASISGHPDATVVTTENDNKLVAFKSLDVAVLSSAKIRRFYLYDPEQEKGSLACGTNEVHKYSKGFTGQDCVNCPFKGQLFDKSQYHENQRACSSQVVFMVYVPKFNVVAMASFGGNKWMPASDFLKQVSTLSKAVAKEPVFQSQGLKRVNNYFIKGTLVASDFKKGGESWFNELDFIKAEPPYSWGQLLWTPDVVKTCKEKLEEHRDFWQSEYIDTPTGLGDQTALLEAEKTAGLLPANTSEATIVSEGEVTVTDAEYITAEPQPVAQSVAMPVQTEAPVAQSSMTLADL